MKTAILSLVAMVLSTVAPAFSQRVAQSPRSSAEEATTVAVEIAGLHAMPLKLAGNEAAVFNRVVHLYKTGERDAALKEWTGLVRGLSRRGVKTGQINALSNWLLRKAYLESDRNLLQLAEKTHHFEHLKNELGKHLGDLKRQRSKLNRTSSKLSTRVIDQLPEYRQGTAPTITWHSAVLGSADVTSEMMNATREMQEEMNQSFNRQYLQLQQKMQLGERQYTAVSNMMKAKHNMAKSTINNVR